jgi:protein-S-isoprenylcysteine O-methyltransferase Ste14
MRVSEAFLRDAIPAMWAAWIVYWIVAARDVKPTSWRESKGANALHGIPLVLCLLLLVVPRRLPAALTQRLVPPSLALTLLGIALVAAGLLFAVWARVCLGRNWSGRVEVKEGHALVRDGPYRAVRHPIYSGLLLALAGTACAIGAWRGVLAFLCALAGILLRVRAEEARMRATFPEYEEYRRHSWALLPPLF